MAAATKAQALQVVGTRERVEQRVPEAHVALCILRVLHRAGLRVALLALGLVMLGPAVADPVSVRPGLVSAHGLAERRALPG